MQVSTQGVGQLLVENLVPVRMSEAKAGTPTVMFGKGRLHMFAGDCRDAGVAEKDGQMTVLIVLPACGLRGLSRCAIRLRAPRSLLPFTLACCLAARARPTVYYSTRLELER